ncbi:MAG: hypothetical protein JNK05_05475 [Myxococcales bacterium]|nr:hypothetical protein [Myxococcales bacterium]
MLLVHGVMGASRISAYDAFFLAYQRRARVAMHLGLDLELVGSLDDHTVERAVAALLARWPELGSVVRPRAFGLAFEPARDALARILRPLGARESSVIRALNEEIDPFSAPPLTVHRRREEGVTRVILRVHHVAADGELFVKIAEALVAALAGEAPEPERPARPTPKANGPSWLARLRDKQRRDEAIARSEHQMLPLACVEPGPCAVLDARIESRAWAAVRARAEREGTSVALWVIAAWARAVHGAMPAREGARIAVEVPVSVRRREGLGDRAGNHLAPVVFFVDAREPIERVARALRGSLRQAVASGQLETDRALAAPGAALPWALFERVAVTPTTTGNASAHVAALSVDESPWSSTARRSRGRLALRRFVPFSPVCLKMGAALTAVCAPDEACLAVTYRERAMDAGAARALLDRALAELHSGAAVRRMTGKIENG